MITIEKTLDFPVTYPLEQFGSLETLLFFDIETTGFSGSSSSLYLIGCVFYKESSWHLIQWFADRADAEEELLHEFFHFLSSFSVLIHFNGDGFDIPYLLKRCSFYGLSCDFSAVESIDIYKKCKPLKNLPGLSSLKQKSIETFLGVCRKDQYSGGELIDCYKNYLFSHDETLYKLLLLHNEDDLKGMPNILPILFYTDFLRGKFTLLSQEICDNQESPNQIRTDSHTSPILSLTYKSPVSVPVPVTVKKDCFEVKLSGSALILNISLLNGTLKRFYPDYQNYFYLIYEDTAIHKSVGQYVDSSARKKATARTCYTKMQGLFLPQPEELLTPCLKQDYKDKRTYVPYKKELFSSEETAFQYAQSVLRSCLLRLP